TEDTVYHIEGDRAKVMNQSFQDIFGHLDNIRNADGTEVDSLLQTEAARLNQGAAIVMIEYKNEIGTGSNDPTIQGGLVYARYWSQSEVSFIAIYFNFLRSAHTHYWFSAA